MPHDLSKHPIHLRLGAAAVPQPEFAGDMAWYEAYGARHTADVEAPVRALFITAGKGTEHRPR